MQINLEWCHFAYNTQKGKKDEFIFMPKFPPPHFFSCHSVRTPFVYLLPSPQKFLSSLLVLCVFFSLDCALKWVFCDRQFFFFSALCSLSSPLPFFSPLSLSHAFCTAPCEFCFPTKHFTNLGLKIHPSSDFMRQRNVDRQILKRYNWAMLGQASAGAAASASIRVRWTRKRVGCLCNKIIQSRMNCKFWSQLL